MTRKIFSAQMAFLLACLLPLLSANVVQVLITYYYSIDRGWWPVLLGLLSVMSLAYSGMATALAKVCRSYKPALIARHATVLGLVLIAHTVAFFVAQPEWPAVDNGLARLTPFQRVVYSGFLPWLIYLFFYIVLVIRFIRLSRRDRSAK